MTKITPKECPVVSFVKLNMSSCLVEINKIESLNTLQVILI